MPPGIRGFLATSRNSFEISAFRGVLKTRFLSLKTIGHPYCKGALGWLPRPAGQSSPARRSGLNKWEATREAWAAPGVHSVENLITVEP